MSISSYVHNSSDDQSLPEDQMTIYVQGNQCARIMNISRHKSAYMQECHPLDFHGLHTLHGVYNWCSASARLIDTTLLALCSFPHPSL